MSRVPTFLTRPAAALAILFVAFIPVRLAAQNPTWVASPVDAVFHNTSNWSTGTVPAGNATIAEFGASSTTGISVNTRMTVGTLQFNSDSTAPYFFTFANVGATNSTGHHLRGAGIVNDSSWAPTLLFQGGAMDFTGSTGSLDDANLIFNSANFYFLAGQGGTSTIQMNGGFMYHGHNGSTVDGENARLVLSGAQLATLNPVDSANFHFGSLEGSGSVQLSQDSTLSVGGNNRDATFSGTIFHSGTSTSRTITKTGTGTWTLSGTNSSDAAVTITGGAIAADTNARLGTGGALTLNGGTFRYAAAFDDLRAVVLGASNGTIDTQAYDVTHSTGISGSGGLTKLGSGTLTLSAANTHTGGTTLTAGTLTVGDDAALGTGALTLNGGTLAASGARTLASSVTLAADATIGGSSALTLSGPLTLSGSRSLTVSNTATTTISGSIGESSTSTFIKHGSGTLELTGANTYTGGTLIGAGTVRINNSTGSAFGTGAVTVASGATLTGAGSFTGALQNNGTFSPGNSPTLETLSTFNQGADGTLVLELGGLARGTQYDALNITGAAVFGGTLTVILIDDFDPVLGNSFNLFDWGTASGTFSTLNLPSLGSGLTWSTSSLYTNGEISVSAVPEPSTYAALFGACALGLAAWRRRFGVR